MVLQALIPFVELNQKALFTQKVLYNDVVSENSLSEVDGNADYYQRRLDSKRLKDIKKYIYNSILDEKENVAVSALFPTAMILAVEQEELPIIENDLAEIVFGKEQKLYIVDGQHRLMAMRQLYEEIKRYLFREEDEEYILNYLTNYKFNCTVLVNYDIWEQGQVFVNVNFKQKPVNRSLYYDVFGAEYIEGNDPKNLERNKIYLAHELTRFMNENVNSPFYKNIRMLGTGRGYVSQSFFVEALLPLFKDSGIWYFDPKSKDVTFNTLNTYKSELFNYYLTVSKSFYKYWGVGEDNKVNFICKTTGVGAFTKLMSILHRQMDSQILESLKDVKTGEEVVEYNKEITKYMQPLIAKQVELFGPNSNYGKTGGKGIEDTLYKRLIGILQESGLLKKDTMNNTKKVEYVDLIDTISQNYKLQLEKQGITFIEEDLMSFMNGHLPSEVDALGTHCSIDEIDKVIISRVNILDKKEIEVSGTFVCTIDISFDNEDKPFASSFPGTFTAQYKKADDKWQITEEGSRIFVNTDSYYR